MSYQIRTIEFHQNRIERDTAKNVERLDYDVSEVGLSSWASSQMIDFDRLAIRLLKNGAELGIDGPAARRELLVEVETGRVVSRRRIDNQWGSSWLLGDEDADRYGRRFIPYGSNSRIQRSHGLKQTEAVEPCSRFVRSRCAGIGLPVSFSPRFD
jgi:hypothetical protein